MYTESNSIDFRRVHVVENCFLDVNATMLILKKDLFY